MIVSCDVLEHVHNMERSLDEIRRVLRAGGSFIGFVPMEGGFGPHAFFRLLDRNIFRDTKDHHHSYRRRQLQRSLASRFTVVQYAYSYHVIGSMLDAAFFAGFKAPIIGPKLEQFWRGQENYFYRSEAARSTPSALARLARVANLAAYWESRWLRKCAYGCIGLHFHLQKP